MPAPEPSFGLAPELAALAQAAQASPDEGILPSLEKKPRLILLVTKLAPEVDEEAVQQILEQCGEIFAWRRGRGSSGEKLSFGFAQFGDPEAAWKASVCLPQRKLCGQEIKVLVEEGAEAVIQQWRKRQMAALGVQTDEELDWELEKVAVSCKAAIDAKVEELYGSQALPDGASSAAAQRLNELRASEATRLDRIRKRKSWRESEFSKVLEAIEREEKRLRKEELELDEADLLKEDADEEAKHELLSKQLAKMPDGQGEDGKEIISRADAAAIRGLVDRVQAEPRDIIFRTPLDMQFLRREKVFETKLRPWLEKKIDIAMGGPQSDLVEYILRRVNAATPPESLTADLVRFMDEYADTLVERIWRMLTFELARCGLALQKEDNLEQAESKQG